MTISHILTIRSERDPQARAHIVFKSRPNYTLCGVRLVGEWIPAGDDPTGDQVCAKCRASYTQQVHEDEARWAAWQAGEAKPERRP